MMDNMASIKQAETVNPAAGNVALPRVSRGIYVGVTGNLAVIFAGDSAAVTLIGLAAGVWHPMQVQQINQSGTSATDVVVGY